METIHEETFFDKLLDGLRGKTKQLIVPSEDTIKMDVVKENILVDAQTLGLPELDSLTIENLKPVGGASLNNGPPIILPNRNQESSKVFEDGKVYWGCQVPIYAGEKILYCIVVVGNVDTTVVFRQEEDGYDPTMLLWRSYQY